MWSLGKTPDPRALQVLRAFRGVALNAAQDGAAADLGAWSETFREAGREALMRRGFEDAPHPKPPDATSDHRLRAYWALGGFLLCTAGGVVVGLYRWRYPHHGEPYEGLAPFLLGASGVALGIGLAALVLLTKFFLFASRPLRRKAEAKVLESRFHHLDPTRRAEAVERVLSGAEPQIVARELGVSVESLRTWGEVYLDAGQGALKQRFGAAS